MKKMIFVMMLGACGDATLSGSCDLSGYRGLVGQNVSVLEQRSDANFEIIKSGEVWTGAANGGQTIVFLDADENILSFGCG